jgi:chromosome segregation ATPase
MTEKVKNITTTCSEIKTQIENVESTIKQLQEQKTFLEKEYKTNQTNLLEAVKEALSSPEYENK